MTYTVIVKDHDIGQEDETAGGFDYVIVTSDDQSKIAAKLKEMGDPNPDQLSHPPRFVEL